MVVYAAPSAPVPAPPATIPTGRFGVATRTWAIFLTFLGFYLLTASGHLYAVDEETLYRITESVVERRTLALPKDAWGVVLSEQVRADGRNYAQYEPGQPLAAIPFYLDGRAVAPLFPPGAEAYIIRFFVSLFSAFVTAATVALLYRLVGALGYGERVALGLASLYGLATFAWPYARTFYAEPLATLCLLATFYALQRGTARLTDAVGIDGQLRRVRASVLLPLFLAGLAAGAALLVKPHAALVLPGLGLYLLGRTPTGPQWPLRLRLAAQTAATWMAGFGVAIVPLLLINAAIYGGPFQTGYSAGRLSGLALPFMTGFTGMTISSGKGFIWYSPPVLLALLGARAFYRRHRAEALTCLGIILIHLAFYARLSLWNGDWAWGPRYLLLILPFALLPAAAFLARARGRPLWRATVVAIAVVGVAVQLLGTLVNFGWDRTRIFDEPKTDAERAARIDARFFSPPESPLVVHARYLGRHLAEWRPRVFTPPDTAILGAGFATPEINPARATFPRWTTGAGTITLHPAATMPLLVKVTFFDYRPPAQRAAAGPSILVNGTPLPEAAIERRDFSSDGTGWIYQLTVPAEAIRDGRATVTLASPTWNPSTTGRGERDEALGLYVNSIEVWREGKPMRVRDGAALIASRAFGAVPQDPAALYLWFNDERTFGAPEDVDPTHHLIDHWAWYAAVAGLERGTALRWIAAYGLAATLPLLAGLALFARGRERRDPGATAPAGRRRGKTRRRTAATARSRPHHADRAIMAPESQRDMRPGRDRGH
ncbi:MAG TPA: phospholipid carrier-dependent glycosyltransferase [Thermomicrobiales bacterium]